jgi:nephrocystin-3
MGHIQGYERQQVKMCLDAIQKSDIFIGFFGQRYGSSMLDGKSEKWLMLSLELCYEQFPWLKQHTQKSVTHLEFECGYKDEHQLRQNDPAGPVVGYAYFLFNEFDEDQVPKNEADAWKYWPENPESSHCLQQLKEDTETWAKQGRGAVFTYGTPKDFVQNS